MKESKIKVSIILPIYNAEKSLKKCLKSILNQSLKEIEVICVNDGSKDNSINILNYFKEEDSRIIVIDKCNEGASKARNVAIERSSGEYCLNVDSDDWLEEDYLEAVYTFAKQNNLDMLITDLNFDYPNKTRIVQDLKIDNEKIITGREYIKLFFKINPIGFTQNKLIKTDLYKNNKFTYNENIFLCEDMELIGKMIYYAERVGKLNKAFYHYIQDGNNGSQKVKLKNLTDRMECYNNLIDYYNEKKEDEIKKDIISERDITLISELIEKDFYKLEGYNEVLEEINNLVRESKKNIKNYGIHTKYQILTITVIKKLNFIPLEFLIQIFKLISKIKKKIKKK